VLLLQSDHDIGSALDLDVANSSIFISKNGEKISPRNHKTFMVFIIIWKLKKRQIAKIRLPLRNLKKKLKIII
jgi:hypothetical protein